MSSLEVAGELWGMMLRAGWEECVPVWLAHLKSRHAPSTWGLTPHLPFSWIFYFLYIHGRRLVEEGCNVSFRSQVICRVPIPLFPKSFEIVWHTFLLMHDYLKVISRNFHNSPLRYRLQLSSSSRFRHWDNRQFTDEHSNGRIKSQTYAILPLSWFRESRKLTCVTILIPPLGRDWLFLISFFSPQEPLLYPLAHSLGLTTMVPVPRPCFPWKTLSCLP